MYTIKSVPDYQYDTLKPSDETKLDNVLIEMKRFDLLCRQYIMPLDAFEGRFGVGQREKQDKSKPKIVARLGKMMSELKARSCHFEERCREVKGKVDLAS
jgi:hypothetical protein